MRQYRYDMLQAETAFDMRRKQLYKEYADASRQLRHNLEVFRTQKDSYRQAEDVYEVTEDGHVRINIDLSNMLSGGTSVTYDIDIAYKPLFSDEKSIVYVAKTVPGEDGNVTTISKAELNGKAFDPDAMQQMLSK